MERRVCFFNIAAGLGGAERSLLEIIRGLQPTSYKPMLVVPLEGPLTAKMRALGVPVFIHPLPGILMKLGRYARATDYLKALRGALLLRYYRRWFDTIDREAVDIVHTNSVKTTFLTAPIRWGRPGVRIVWHIRDVMRGKRRFFPLVDALGRRIPDAIVANSDFTAAQFRRSRDRVVRIYNGVVLGDYAAATPQEKAEFKRRWNVPGSRRAVGILGIISPLKGHRVFLDAAKRVLASRVDAHFFVIGDEVYDTAGHRGRRAQLEQYAADLGIASRVTFTGFLDDVEKAIRCLDVLVQSSVEPESFGRVVVEAQASGVPVVASRIGALPEIVSDPSLGMLVSPGSDAETADAVMRLLADPELHRRIAEAGRRNVVERFTVDRVVDDLVRLYDRLLAGRPT